MLKGKLPTKVSSVALLRYDVNNRELTLYTESAFWEFLQKGHSTSNKWMKVGEVFPIIF